MAMLQAYPGAPLPQPRVVTYHGMAPMSLTPGPVAPVGETRFGLKMASFGSWQVEALLWLPWTGFMTFWGTVAICGIISVHLSGGSPCGDWLCDISVYGGWPKYGAEWYVFFVGLTLFVAEMFFLFYCRHVATGNWAFILPFSLSMLALLGVAYIPFWKSSVHFICAEATFALLAIGGLVDTVTDCTVPGCLICVRLALLVLMALCFGTWIMREENAIAAPEYEYLAVIFAMAYPLTWTRCNPHEARMPEDMPFVGSGQAP